MAEIVKKAFLISGAQSLTTRPPAGLAFMAGCCENLGINYIAYDLNIEFMHHVGRETWNQIFSHVNTGKGLANLDKELDGKLDQYLLHLIDQIKKYDPDVIAITLLSYMQQQWTHRLLECLRKHINKPIIAGGPGISVPYHMLPESERDHTFGHWLVDQDLLDFYVLGEGDMALPKFLQGHTDIPGLNHKHHQDSWQPQIDNLDPIPIPSYKKINLSLYDTPDNGQHRISITGSRGCVRRCTFCDVGHLWKKFRFRSGKNIANEILQHHLDTGAVNFWFNDSLINGSLKQFYQLMSSLVEYKQTYLSLDPLLYQGQFIIRPKGNHPEKLYKLMKDSGCTQIMVGIESGSETVRDHMQKKFSNADIDYHLEMCEKYGIKNWFLLIVGYPTETQQDFESTKDMLRKYQKYVINQTVLGLNLQYMMAILPNTPLEGLMSEMNIHMIDNIDGSYTNWHSLSNPDLTLEKRYQRFGELVDLALDLRYPLPNEINYFLQRNINQSNPKKFIKIQTQTDLNLTPLS